MKHKNKFEEYESVELTHNINKSDLKKGERGIVVEIYNNGAAYEVEFIKPNGGTKALLTLMPDDIQHVTTIMNFNVVFNNSFGGNITNEASKSLEETKVNTKTKNSNGKEDFSYTATL